LLRHNFFPQAEHVGRTPGFRSSVVMEATPHSGQNRSSRSVALFWHTGQTSLGEKHPATMISAKKQMSATIEWRAVNEPAANNAIPADRNTASSMRFFLR
jgi:hypothetical protein